MKLGFNLVSDMAIKVGLTSVIWKKSSSLCLFLLSSTMTSVITVKFLMRHILLRTNNFLRKLKLQ